MGTELMITNLEHSNLVLPPLHQSIPCISVVCVHVRDKIALISHHFRHANRTSVRGGEHGLLVVKHLNENYEQAML